MEQRVGVSVYAAGKLYLLDHLVGGVVELLLDRDDREQVDDESQYQHGDEDEDHSREVVRLRRLRAPDLTDSLCQI